MNRKNVIDSLDQFILAPVFLAMILVLSLILALPAKVAIKHIYEPPHLLLA
jgi:hypothetical protein